MSDPVRIRPNEEAIPEALRGRDQWVAWRIEIRDGEPTKLPVDAETGSLASATDPNTWSGFEAVWDYHTKQDTDTAGIGFVFCNPPDRDSEEYERLTEDQQSKADERRPHTGAFAGVDLDDCRDPDTKEIDGWARDILNELDTYAEVSPSGTGVHAILRGNVPDGGNRSGDVEMYDDARFFTMTGRRLEVDLWD